MFQFIRHGNILNHETPKYIVNDISYFWLDCWEKWGIGKISIVKKKVFLFKKLEIIDLQSFRCITKWFCYICMYIHIFRFFLLKYWIQWPLFICRSCWLSILYTSAYRQNCSYVHPFKSWYWVETHDWYLGNEQLFYLLQKQI